LLEFSDFLKKGLNEAAATQSKNLTDPKISFDSYAWTCGFYGVVKGMAEEMPAQGMEFIQNATVSLSSDKFSEFLEGRLLKAKEDAFNILAHGAPNEPERQRAIGQYEGIQFVLAFLKNSLIQWRDQIPNSV